DGQGNFGSVDGDPPAAYRYTEARLARLAEELLADIDKETVDFIANFDDTTVEPTVLPTKIPNLLVNGASGIAVGMATNIPPHNLTEVLDACALLIRKPNTTLREVMELVPGPDFPTGGFIFGKEGIAQAYKSGRGTFHVRAKAAIEEVGRDKQNIVITEIPYQVNKARLIERIAELVNERRLEGIADLRDESDREGMRIVLELKRGEQPEIILNNLYKHTQMQMSFGVILLAIVNGQPRELGLIEVLQLFINHRVEVVRRRTEHDLNKARAREHILLGFQKALAHLDAIIKLIRASKSPVEAKAGLVRRWDFSDRQAQAILDLQLHRLTQLEREKILQELKQIQALVKDLEGILGSEARLKAVITDELRQMQKSYGDERRTQIVAQVEEISLSDLVPEEDVAITVTHNGYLKRTPVEAYKHQGRGGKGRFALKAGERDFVKQLFVASTHGYLLVFTNTGKVYWLRVWDIPEGGWASRGKAINQLVKLESGEQIAAFLPVNSLEEAGKFIFFATRNGTVKKTELSQFANIRSTGIIAIGLEEGDELVGAKLTDGRDMIFLASRNGMAILFRESDVRAMGRQAYGVRGMKLSAGGKGKKGRAEPDSVVGMEGIAPDWGGGKKARTGEPARPAVGGASLAEVPDEGLKQALPDLILTATEKGYGKRTLLKDYRIQSRGGKGVKNIKTTEKNGPVVAVARVAKDTDAMIVTQQGKLIRVHTKQIRAMGRATQGVRLLRLTEGDRVAAAAALIEEQEAEAVVEAAATPAPAD
ncbi:MAG: DNA gyrase subunit A, partial [Terriglobia bacterium]